MESVPGRAFSQRSLGKGELGIAITPSFKDAGHVIVTN
ncbi:hypothetical protein GGR34_001333 [Microvirga flocculans]|uniref:Uncharacterized protein n=1 Tax=Microvirga flocculans TaxID=217168 RepID=A0A7W6IEI4_9HYPH|nr:hypothetical protein [Microvirga flocculans]